MGESAENDDPAIEVGGGESGGWEDDHPGVSLDYGGDYFHFGQLICRTFSAHQNGGGCCCFPAGAAGGGPPCPTAFASVAEFPAAGQRQTVVEKGKEKKRKRRGVIKPLPKKLSVQKSEVTKQCSRCSPRCWPELSRWASQPASQLKKKYDTLVECLKSLSLELAKNDKKAKKAVLLQRVGKRR